MDSGSQRITFFELLLVKPRKLLIFAPLNGKIPCGCGVIGSRARLRIWCREACRFESYHPHIDLKKPSENLIPKAFSFQSQNYLFLILPTNFLMEPKPIVGACAWQVSKTTNCPGCTSISSLIGSSKN